MPSLVSPKFEVVTEDPKQRDSFTLINCNQFVNISEDSLISTEGVMRNKLD
jgi:hypothetical protein